MMTYPPSSEVEFATLLREIQHIGFQPNQWNLFKKVYKQVEHDLLHFASSQTPPLPQLIRLMAALIARVDEANPQTIDHKFPTQATLRYMKRRARRLLNQLAQNQPEMYISLAKALVETQTGKTALEAKHQWALMHLCYATSIRCRQKAHGQGHYAYNTYYHLNQTEAHFVNLWQPETNYFADLLQQDLPWQLLEWAANYLKRANIHAISLSETQIIRLLQAPSFTLNLWGRRLAYEMFLVGTSSPELTAELWFLADRNLRQKMEQISQKRPAPKNSWLTAYYTALWQKLQQYIAQSHQPHATLNRRVKTTLHLLKKEALSIIKINQNEHFIALLLKSGDASLQKIALQAVGQIQENQILPLLKSLGKQRLAALDQVMEDVLKNMFNIYRSPISSWRGVQKFIQSEFYYVFEFGWVVSKKLSQYRLYQLWKRIFSTYELIDKETKQLVTKGNKFDFLTKTLSSTAGVDALVRYCEYSNYFLVYLEEPFIHHLCSLQNAKIDKLIRKCFLLQLEQSGIYNMHYITRLPDEIRKEIWEQYLKNIKGKSLQDLRIYSYWYLSSFFRYAEESTWMQQAFLDILRVIKLDKESITNSLASELLQAPRTGKFILQQIETSFDDKIKNAFFSYYKNNLAQYLDKLHLLPSNWLNLILVQAPLSTLLDLVQNLTDSGWKELKPMLHALLTSKTEEEGFWQSVLERAMLENQTNLRARLLQDRRFAALFRRQSDTAILNLQFPELEDMLLLWVTKNEKLFRNDDALKLTLATYKLPRIRAWAIERLSQWKIDAILGLHFLESGVPDAINFAQQYFEQLRTQPEQFLEEIIHLVDSPEAKVRDFALRLLQQQHKAAPQAFANLLICLTEHSNAQIQAFVAEKLQPSLEQPVLTLNDPVVQQFDKAVLRMKYRSRQAKEAVKSRLNTQPQTASAAVLLELAQSPVKKDAEWAIVQLTKLALAGEEIQGFELR